MKLLNFANWCDGEVSKSAEIRLSKSIFYVKNHQNVSDVFFVEEKNMNLGAHFLLVTFFDKINFQITLFSKICPIFDSLPLILCSTIYKSH